MKYTIRILIGTGLTALAVKCVYEPTDMVIGGFSGVAIVLRSLFGLPLGATTFMLNIPVYFAAWKMKGFRFVRWSAMATVSLSLWLSVIPSVNLSFKEVRQMDIGKNRCHGLNPSPKVRQKL